MELSNSGQLLGIEKELQISQLEGSEITAVESIIKNSIENMKIFFYVQEKINLALSTSDSIEKKHIKSYFDTCNAFGRMEEYLQQLQRIPAGDFVSNVRTVLQEI